MRERAVPSSPTASTLLITKRDTPSPGISTWSAHRLVPFELGEAMVADLDAGFEYLSERDRAALAEWRRRP